MKEGKKSMQTLGFLEWAPGGWKSLTETQNPEGGSGGVGSGREMAIIVDILDFEVPEGHPHGDIQEPVDRWGHGHREELWV